jgi:hypothetical protein
VRRRGGRTGGKCKQMNDREKGNYLRRAEMDCEGHPEGKFEEEIPSGV